MHGPALSGWLLVVLCAATGLSCLLRMRASGGDERRTAGGEAVMGFGMAVMALPAAVLTPPGWSWTVYAAVFGAATLHALTAIRRGGHHLHHLIGSLAMLYMAVAMAAPGSPGAHAGHSAAVTGPVGGIPALTGALLLYYVGYVLRAGTRLVPVAAVARGPGPAWAARPELALACRLAMALGMLAMLVTL
ncbi:DUF5134 domain-containing protein [Streptomyces sp. NPDC093089]|uniref:DUF5134 domain-containing protein n=1 Tax=Streptomyces sp. NPDC093089 TaxID=3366024 RepID=UPI003806D297